VYSFPKQAVDSPARVKGKVPTATDDAHVAPGNIPDGAVIDIEYGLQAGEAQESTIK
jgi:hypothetical protein